MQYTIKTQNGDISFTLTRKKVKNINMRVGENGEVKVSAGRLVPLAAINSFVRAKSDWIIAALSRRQPVLTPQFCDGCAIPYLGGSVTLSVANGTPESAVLSEGVLTVTTADTSEPAVRLAVERWLDRQCQEVFAKVDDKTAEIFLRYGFSRPSLRLRTMKTRWGSLSMRTKTVTLNRKLIFAPISAIEYVAAHEYTHLLHQDHSKAFYAFLEKVYPDYKAQRKLLRQYENIQW